VSERFTFFFVLLVLYQAQDATYVERVSIPCLKPNESQFTSTSSSTKY